MVEVKDLLDDIALEVVASVFCVMPLISINL